MSETKRQALEKSGALKKKAERVRSPLFDRLDFFDARDTLQVKYEMLRCHEVDGLPISRAAEQFGYTRQAYYQIRDAFAREGIAGLAGKKRGRKGPVKCTPAVLAFLVQEKQREPELTGEELAARLLAEKGVELHRRTVEKIVVGLPSGRRRKKKPLRCG